MRRLILILGDQLSPSLSALADLDPQRDIVLMVEVAEEAHYVPHHKQKIALLFSAMRHFAAELQARGMAVDYVRLDDPANSHSFSGEVARAVQRHGPDQIIVTEPGEWRVLQMIEGWQRALNLPVTIRPDGRFFCSRAEFAALAKAGKTSRMEYFYRDMRRHFGVLMQTDGTPEGGQWNFDHDNRKAPPKGLAGPEPLCFEPDGTTRAVIA
jgi:deoxyribodipyrimidine photolyase-related protein